MASAEVDDADVVLELPLTVSDCGGRVCGVAYGPSPLFLFFPSSDHEMGRARPKPRQAQPSDGTVADGHLTSTEPRGRGRGGSVERGAINEQESGAPVVARPPTPPTPPF